MQCCTDVSSPSLSSPGVTVVAKKAPVPASAKHFSDFITYPGDNGTGSAASEQLVSLPLIMADKEQGVKGGKAATDSERFNPAGSLRQGELLSITYCCYCNILIFAND